MALQSVVFPGAVGADERGDAPDLDLQVESLQGGNAAEADREVADMEDRHISRAQRGVMLVLMVYVWPPYRKRARTGTARPTAA